MKIDSMFPTCIASVEYIENVNLKPVLTNNLPTGRINPRSESLFHYYEDNSILYKKELKDFFVWCEDMTTDFVKNTLQKDIEKMIITDCWLNVCDYGGKQNFHNHTNSYISGTYYVNKTDNHADLSFQSPYSQSANVNTIDLDNLNTNEYNATHFTTPVKEGSLYLWPAFLKHGYEENMQDNRISLSINFMPNIVKNDTYGYKIERL
jgi:uncharacterized protein (TIGR02466 family)